MTRPMTGNGKASRPSQRPGDAPGSSGSAPRDPRLEPAEAERRPDSVFIVKTKEGSLKGVENFLKNRDFSTASAYDLRDALADILKANPDYVLICVDHGNPKVRGLPRLIQQACKARVIVCAETNVKALSSFVLEHDFPYALYPPLSGPAIERMILKIQRDERKALEGADSAYGPSNAHVASRRDDDDSVIAIHGGDADGSAVRVSGGALRGRAEATAAGERQARDGRLTQAPSERTDEASRAIASGAEPDGESEARLPTSPGRSRDGDSSAGLRRSKSFLEIEKRGQHRHSLKEEGPEALKRARRTAGAEPEPSLDERVPARPDDALAVAAETALKRTVRGREGLFGDAPDKRRPDEARLDRVTRVGCMEVEASGRKGYLLAAWAYDRAIDEALVSELREKLAEVMAERGEPVELSRIQALELREVTFEGWASRQADFLKRSVHGGGEIAVAFFPGQVEASDPEECEHEDMARVSLSWIKGDERVEFGVYLRMEANDKFLLYARNGRRLYESQKSRLRERGVHAVYLRRDAAVDLRRYRIQNYLNDKIAEAGSEPLA